jgi:serine/threonine-protein kinase
MGSVTRRCPACGKVYPNAVFFCGEDGTITIQVQEGGDVDSRLGSRLGGYLVVARVADGAMGRVYEGRHPETKARVAVKVLHAHVARDPVSVERFKREFESSTEIGHAHVVKVLESGETPDGSHFLTMEYLEGEELGQVLGHGQPLQPARIVRIICQLALALEHAHSFGFVHRDLKPDNIFLCNTPDGDDVRVLDFGSVKSQVEMGAKLTAIGTTVGSPYYMSPEQAMGRSDVDQRTDVFAVGAILYEMLTDKIAFEARNVAMILMRIMNEHPASPSSLNPSCPVTLDAVVAKALRKAKAERYEGVRQLAEALLVGYRLSESIETWAARPRAEIETALLVGMRSTPVVPADRAKSEVRSGDEHGDATVPKMRLATEDQRGGIVTASGTNLNAMTLVALGVFVAVGLLVLLLR